MQMTISRSFSVTVKWSGILRISQKCGGQLLIAIKWHLIFAVSCMRNTATFNPTSGNESVLFISYFCFCFVYFLLLLFFFSVFFFLVMNQLFIYEFILPHTSYKNYTKRKGKLRRRWGGSLSVTAHVDVSSASDQLQGNTLQTAMAWLLHAMCISKTSISTTRSSRALLLSLFVRNRRQAMLT